MIKRQKPQQVQSATSLPLSPHDDQRRRIRQYSIAMGIRMGCIPFIFLLHGYWVLIPAAGVIVLPYVAVVLANAGGPGAQDSVRTPQLALTAKELPADDLR